MANAAAAASTSAVSRFVAAKCAVYLNNVLLVVVAFYLFSLLAVWVSIGRQIACLEMWGRMISLAASWGEKTTKNSLGVMLYRAQGH